MKKNSHIITEKYHVLLLNQKTFEKYVKKMIIKCLKRPRKYINTFENTIIQKDLFSFVPVFSNLDENSFKFDNVGTESPSVSFKFSAEIDEEDAYNLIYRR